MIRRLAPFAALIALGGCVAEPAPPPAQGSAVIQPIRAPMPASTPSPTGPATFAFDGLLTQGGWIRGQVPGGTRRAVLGGQPLTIDAQGRFFAAFDRDAGPNATLTAQLADGRTITSPVRISPRDWAIERAAVAE